MRESLAILCLCLFVTTSIAGMCAIMADSPGPRGCFTEETIENTKRMYRMAPPSPHHFPPSQLFIDVTQITKEQVELVLMKMGYSILDDSLLAENVVVTDYKIGADYPELKSMAIMAVVADHGVEVSSITTEKRRLSSNWRPVGEHDYYTRAEHKRLATGLHGYRQ